MVESVLPFRGRGLARAGAPETRSRRWASAALPIVTAAFVLGVSAVRIGQPGAYPPGRFAGFVVDPASLAAFVAAGVASVLLLAFLAGNGQGLVLRLRRGARPDAFVRTASARSMRDALDVRGAMLALVARSVALHASDRDIDRLAERLDRAAGFGDLVALERGLVAICDNRAAREVFALTDRRLGPPDGGAAPGERRRVALAWRGLIEALRARDPATAETIVRRLCRLQRGRWGPEGEGR